LPNIPEVIPISISLYIYNLKLNLIKIAQGKCYNPVATKTLAKVASDV